MIVAGVVDKLILEFEKRVFDTPELGRKWMDDFLKKVVLTLTRLLTLSQ